MRDDGNVAKDESDVDQQDEQYFRRHCLVLDGLFAFVAVSDQQKGSAERVD